MVDNIKITDDEYIKGLFDLGYINSGPSATDQVVETSLGKLTLAHPIIRAATRDFQMFLSSSLERAVQDHYPDRVAAGIGAYHDGDAGVATKEAMVQRLNTGCGCADFETAATGTGSMPAGCHSERFNLPTDEHQMTFGVDERRMPDELKQIRDYGPGIGKMRRIDRIIDRVIFSCALRGMRLIRRPVEEETNFDISWEHGRGWIGLAQYNQKKCRTYSFCKLDIGYCSRQGDDRIAILLLHEVGHVIGLPHVRQSTRNVMSPVLEMRRYVGFADGDASVPRLKGYYSDVPIDLEEKDIVTPSDIRWSSRLQGKLDGDIVFIDGFVEVTIGDRTARAFAVPDVDDGIFILEPDFSVV